MKKGVLILLAGVLIGALGWHVYQQNRDRAPVQQVEEVAAQTREAAAAAKGRAASSARAMGAVLGDASIVARIKGKHLLDPDLSVLAINVECEDGHVTLTGSAKSPALIQRAVRLARETGGVSGVDARLTVRE